MKKFEFIADEKFRSILIRDFTELESCLENNSAKSVLILSGSLIETILVEFFTHNPPKGKTKVQILKMNLSDLIDKAEESGLISSRSKDLSIVIKDYRNLIHPGREIRTKEQFSMDTAIVSFSLVKIILSELEEKYIEKYGYRAEDILKKIKLDSSTYSIYEKLLNKANSHEKVRLTQMLVNEQVDFEVDNKKELVRYGHYISPLLKEIGDENIKAFCQTLLKQVEKGERARIIGLFKVFGNYLHLLDAEQMELILIYIYDVVSDYHWGKESVKNPMYQKICSHLGLYLYTEDLKVKFFELVLDVVTRHFGADDNKWYYRQMYRSLISNFDVEKIEKVKSFVEEHRTREEYSEFFAGMQEDDELPF